MPQNKSTSRRITGSVNQTKLKNKPISKSKRSNLLFSVAKIQHYLRKEKYAKYIQTKAAVYLAATLEYMCHDVLELAVHAMKLSNEENNMKRKQLIPRDVQLAIRNDYLLDILLSKVTIPQGGILPHIHFPQFRSEEMIG